MLIIDTDDSRVLPLRVPLLDDGHAGQQVGLTGQAVVTQQRLGQQVGHHGVTLLPHPRPQLIVG